VLFCGCLPADFWTHKWTWQDRWAYFNSGKIELTDIMLGYNRMRALEEGAKEEAQIAALGFVSIIFDFVGAIGSFSEAADAIDAAAAEGGTPGRGENDAARIGRAWHSLVNGVLQTMREDGYAVAEEGRMVRTGNGRFGRPDGWIGGSPLEVKANTPNGIAQGMSDLRRYLASDDVNADVGYLFLYNDDGTWEMQYAFGD